MFLIFILYIALASTFTIGKAALCYVPPILFVALRMILGGCLLLCYYCINSKGTIKIKREDVYLFVMALFFHIYIAYVLEFWALQFISSARTALMYSLSPFLTALFSYWLFSERLTRNKWIGLIIGLCGLIPWVIITNCASSSCFAYFSLSIPEVVLFCSVVSASYGWIIVKQLVMKEYVSVLVNGVAMLGGGVCAGMTSLIIEGKPHLLSTIPACSLNTPGINHLNSMFGPYYGQITLIAIYLGFLIIVANVIFYNLYAFLLKQYSATLLSFAGISCPFFAMLFGNFYLGEVPSYTFLLSFTVISLGVYIFYREELPKNNIQFN